MAKKKPKPVKPLSTRLQERKYSKAIKENLKALQVLINRELVDQLPWLEGQAGIRADGMRADVEDWTAVLAAIMARIRLSLAGRKLLQRSLADRFFSQTDELNKSSNSRQLKSALGVDALGVEPDLGEVKRAFAASNAALMSDLDDSTLNKIEQAVLRAFAAGRRAKPLSQEISGILKGSQKRADLIAIDQIQKLNGKLTERRQTRLGVTSYKWRTVLDHRVRPDHKKREGVIFDWDDPPFDGHPGEPVRCRCYAEPVFDDETAGKAAKITGKKPEKKKLKKKPEKKKLKKKPQKTAPVLKPITKKEQPVKAKPKKTKDNALQIQLEKQQAETKKLKARLTEQQSRNIAAKKELQAIRSATKATELDKVKKKLAATERKLKAAESKSKPDPFKARNKGVNKEKQREWVESMPTAQKEALGDWGRNSYRSFREMDRGVTPKSDQFNDLVKALDSAPAWEGTAYRGLNNLTPEKAVDMFRVGAVMEDRAMGSWTRVRSVASGFATNAGGGGLPGSVKVVMRVRTKKGIDITPIIGNDEKEVMLKKGSYKVISSKSRGVKQGGVELWEVDLEEN